MPIRMAAPKDLPEILAIYTPYVTDTPFSFEYTVPSLECFTERFLAITAQFPWLVWEEDGKILGYAYGSAPFDRAAYQWCAEDSIYLHPDAQGRGIGRQLHEALEKLLIMQGYQKIYAIITSENKGSLAFHQAMGYRFVAHFPECGYKFEKTYDTIWMEKRLNCSTLPNKTPTPVSLIVDYDKFFL